MTDQGTIPERLRLLARKATGSNRPDLASGYMHAATIVEEDQSAVPLGKARAFCERHCFMGRKDGPGKADDCSICPIAPFTLGVVETDEDDRELERKQAERLKREAASVTKKLDAMGTDTLAAESHVERSGDGLQPVDG